jgi:hypothetical protein
MNDVVYDGKNLAQEKKAAILAAFLFNKTSVAGVLRHEL